MSYYIYHIPGVKVGVTRNPKNRVEKIQGYKSYQYEILETSDDIDYISSREIELQTRYGYRVESKPYKLIFKSMKINCTNNTSTFPCRKRNLKKFIEENLEELEWVLPDGTEMSVNKGNADWVVQNAQKSQFSDNCYIYNKAFLENEKIAETSVEIFDKIREWAEERGLYDKGDVKTQTVKLFEEAGELARGVVKKDQELLIDSIGDCVVVLTNLAHLAGYSIEYCIHHAYDEIKDRKGGMSNGTFIKDE